MHSSDGVNNTYFLKAVTLQQLHVWYSGKNTHSKDREEDKELSIAQVQLKG